MDEISQILINDPENFEALCTLATRNFSENNFAVSFIMAERAIAAFEKQPNDDFHAQYFEIKRLHYQMLHEHLDEIVGPAYQLLDSRWAPVFRLGKVREMAWAVNRKNCLNIRHALNALQLKRLRFLSITFEEAEDNALMQLMTSPLSSLRALSLNFISDPSPDILMEFFTTIQPAAGEINTFGIRIPHLDDEMASCIHQSLGNLEVLSMTSMDRTGITNQFCEELADDERSNHLTRLCLVGTSIGNEGLFSLMSSENFTSLQALDLHDGILTNAAAEIIMASHGLSALHSIDLRYNMIDPAGINAISRCSLKCYCDNQHERPEGRI